MTYLSLKTFDRFEARKFFSFYNFLHYSRSEKLRPFWLTVSEMDTSCLNVLSDALLSREVTKAYREAVTRALDMPGCKVVPFFGGFLRDLRLVLMGVPSVVVMPTDDRQEVEVNHDAECWLVVFNVPSTARSFREGTPNLLSLAKDVKLDKYTSQTGN